eukprot:CAMPEP_0170519864 /NCGR_PEP_ID=MMETSP0209-20121228/5118_1 /TAXON_ID=665100 ORGANISM="Litonotus pictus, Strain P1" /NCGR_SAMPLE_ID=MMETSP0209 /ASSEMBLY_ACC=CAM_ASM_000301 /LENGTH=413 /DNA_ID=CAMNT_0010805847 /DNA_START=3 /DNA_END=1244 /DNA_ORIENTATION=+
MILLIQKKEQLSLNQHQALNLVSLLKQNEAIKDVASLYINTQSDNNEYNTQKVSAEKEASSKVESLEKLLTEEKKIVYIDGVFDIMHSGHFNAVRQASKLSDILYIGINSDEDVAKIKGPTLMNNEERGLIAGSCKWIDKVVIGVPYNTTLEVLDEVGAHYAAHGDDIAYDENGNDVYDEIKKKNRMKTFKRTEGISTTNLLGRLMLCSKSNTKEKEEISNKPLMSKFLTTGWRLREFCNNKIPKQGDKVVYIDGAWDVLHPGHIRTLEYAKSKGDFLYVGIWDDTTTSNTFGFGNPVLSLMERTFNLLSMKYVDDVVISSPRLINEDLIKSLGVDLVIGEESNITVFDKEDPYFVPKQMGVFETYKSHIALNNDFLVQRLEKNKDSYMNKYFTKTKKEEDYYKNQKKQTQEI